jgi:hypothetical protein
MPDLRRQMLLALQRSPSYLILARMRPNIAADIRINGYPIRTEAMAKSIESDEAFRLLHVIPRDLLTSIISGTVAYDLWNGDIDPYTPSTCGVYVMAIHICGRRGKFLSGRELGELATLVDRYVTAYDHWVRDGQRWDEGSEDSRRHRRFVENVDGRETSNGPRFVKSPLSRAITRELANMFRRRQIASIDPDAVHTQSPLFVGRRTGVGSPLASTPTALNLTLGLLKVMGLRPKTGVATVLPTWRREDLPHAARLVAALGRSLVTQDGFNMEQPSGHPDHRAEDALGNTGRMVMERGHYHENASKTVKHIQLESVLLDHLEVVKDRRHNLDRALVRVESKMSKLESKVEILEKRVSGVEDQTEQLRDRKEELCDQLKMMKVVAEDE